MRILIILASLILVSCDYESYPAYGVFYFTIEDSDKTEVLASLDSFAAENDFKKVQEDDKLRIQEKNEIPLHAIYQNREKYRFSISNHMSELCFSASTHDMAKSGQKSAIELSKFLRIHLNKKFANRIRFYTDNWCKNAI